ncbi:exocyst complex component 7 [Exophiala viscosa]|uniref:Exocyst complex protein EXO70 n=1 Tax=Exophiala viscosa TaxID=2486360 RepID=A0AAN6DYL6_9EURO|nr:exocyst complex component 7 [Exophiala viscosa]KAI1626384.1 exocyst complex component 7 [Exophiala viscosa]
MVGTRNAAFAEESAEVEVLIASLGKTRDLTKRIAGSLSRLDASGRIVKDAIGPIYNNTQQLQITSRNIEKVNEAIEKLRQPLDARGREENIIRQGPKAAGLPQYLGALKRVDKALTDLNSSNLRSNQQAISDFHSLLSTGVNQLNDLYRQMLQEDAQTIEPLQNITKEIPFPTITQDKVQLLSQISMAILSAGTQSARLGQQDDDVAARIYAEIRGDYLQNSLQNLSTASISTSKRRANDSSIYREGSSGIGAYAKAVEGMFLAEAENTSRIFRNVNDAGRIFTMTCAKALATFTRTLAELNNFIKSRILTDCFLAYEILDLITPLSYRLDSRTGQLRPQMADALRPIRETARSSLSDLIIQTRRQAEIVSTLPPDGNTIPLVSQTATRLQNLALFDRPLLALLSSIGDGNWRSPQGMTSQSSLNLELTPSSENPNILSHYLLDIVDTLLTTLNTRSQPLHPKKYVQGIFQLNNVAVLSRAVQSSPDLARYIGISPHNAKFDTYRRTASSLYMSAWREPTALLFDSIHTGSGGSRPMSGQAIDSTSIIKSLSSKDKDKIKEKFRLFNASFDDLVARHKSLHMENEVRSSLSREIQGTIEALYGRFWDRYHEVDKGKGKVVKYSKEDFSKLLAGL